VNCATGAVGSLLSGAIAVVQTTGPSTGGPVTAALFSDVGVTSVSGVLPELEPQPVASITSETGNAPRTSARREMTADRIRAVSLHG
jgi:hypothetical protein